jgi:hypothetical protein
MPRLTRRGMRGDPADHGVTHMINARTLCRDLHKATPAQLVRAKIYTSPRLTDDEERARLACLSRKLWEQAISLHVLGEHAYHLIAASRRA